MQITTSCILLGGADFLQQHGGALAALLGSLIGNVKERGMLLLIPVMELVIQVRTAPASQQLVYPHYFTHHGSLPTLLLRRERRILSDLWKTAHTSVFCT